MWLCINTRSEGSTGDLSDCLDPPLLHLIRWSEKKICWSDSAQNFFKAAVRTKIRRNRFRTLSSAWRNVVSSMRFLNRPANNQKKVKQLRKHADNGNKSIQSPLDRCSVADLIVSEHAAYSNRCKITFLSWWIVSFSDFRTFHQSFRTWMKSSASFTMRAFRINVFAFYSLAFFEVGHSRAFSSLTAVQATVNAASGSQRAHSDALHLLRFRMRRQISQTQSQQTERFLNYKCINCNCEFLSLHAYNIHRRHPKT